MFTLFNIIGILMTVAGFLYSYKYFAQYRKIVRLGTSRGVSRTYFSIGIAYEVFCFICTCILLIVDPRNIATWILFILTVLPLVGNNVVFFTALKYAPVSQKNDLKHRLYRLLRKLLLSKKK